MEIKIEYLYANGKCELLNKKDISGGSFTLSNGITLEFQWVEVLDFKVVYQGKEYFITAEYGEGYGSYLDLYYTPKERTPYRGFIIEENIVDAYLTASEKDRILIMDSIKDNFDKAVVEAFLKEVR